MRIHYLYKHIRIDKNEPFYIGIGTICQNDINNSNENIYYRRAFSICRRNEIWKKITNKSKYKIEIVLESNNYDYIKEKEIEFIKYYGRIDLKTGILSNLTDGGDGTVNIKVSDITRQKMSNRMKGTKMSKETRRKMSEKKLQKITKKVIDIKTGVVYKSAKEAAEKCNINISTLHNYLKGRNPNKTNLTWQI